jgi:hypothetical protein
MASDPEQFSLSIYPNPFSENVYIKSNLPVTSINVIDAIGRVVKNFAYPETVSDVIELKLQDRGIYFLEIHLRNGERKVEKVVKM